MGFVLSKFRVRMTGQRDLQSAKMQIREWPKIWRKPTKNEYDYLNLIIEGKVYGGGVGGAADANPGVGEIHDQHGGAEAAVRDQLCGLHHRRVYRGLRTLVLLLLPADDEGVLYVPGAAAPLSLRVSVPR